MKGLLFTIIIFAILFSSLSCDTTSVPTTVKDIKTFQEDVDSDADMELGVKFLLSDNQSHILEANGKVTYIFLYSPSWSGQKQLIFTSERQITDTKSSLPTYFKKANFKVPCDKCRGTGYETCSFCSGKGEVSCSSCNGTGGTGVNCVACHGKGKVDLSTYKRMIGFTSPTGCPWEDFYIRSQIPPGESTLPCPKCNGSGKQACSTCNGRGKINCPKCNGTQRVICTNKDCKDGLVYSSGQTCTLVIKFQRDDGVTIEGRNDSVLLP
jgi:hypothetical protein